MTSIRQHLEAWRKSRENDARMNCRSWAQETTIRQRVYVNPCCRSYCHVAIKPRNNAADDVHMSCTQQQQQQLEQKSNDRLKFSSSSS